jgi:hypothetical protein
VGHPRLRGSPCRPHRICPGQAHSGYSVMIRYREKFSATSSEIVEGERHGLQILAQIGEGLRPQNAAMPERRILKSLATDFKTTFGCAIASRKHQWTQKKKRSKQRQLGRKTNNFALITSFQGLRHLGQQPSEITAVCFLYRHGI